MFHFNLKSALKREKIESLKMLILIRNCILHNGNKASRKLEEFNSDLFTFNDDIILIREELNQYHILIQHVAYETFSAIGEALFNEPKSELFARINYLG